MPLLARLLLLVVTCAPAWPQSDTQRQSLDHLLQTLPPSNTNITGRINAVDKSWEEWVRRTGELPPDWSRMPKNAFLPDPLIDNEGRPVRTRAEWDRRKQWIRDQFQRWVFGTLPPAPNNLRAIVVSEQQEGTITVRNLRLEFGPDQKATLRVQLLIPPGQGPFPVFLTNHPRNRPWVATAVRRGYIGAIYYAADPIYGNDDDSDKWIELYPQHDWSCLARWAWAAMRTVDYLHTLPQVDKAKIAISGHSRNGKQALLAAAFDERITAVSLSSGNTGEGTPWRYTTDAFNNESLEQITRSFPHWFHPRLRFFVGREHQLPVDQNLLMALVAPRGLLLASAYAEGQGAPFGFEQAYRNAGRIYDWLDAKERVGLSLREGEHATTAENIEDYVDFFDYAFGRGGQRPETWILGFDWERWRQRSNEQADITRWAQRAASPDEVRTRLRWTLGEEPPAVLFPNSKELRKPIRTDDGPLALLYGRPIRVKGATHSPVAFGDDLKADLYYPEAAASNNKLPLVIWLHGFTHQTGYSKDSQKPFAELIARGYAVLAFDQIGFGTRIHSARRFYDRYPHWSLMGKMVADTRAAVSAAAALPNVDPQRIYLLGQSLGSKVALYTAALEPQVAGLALFGGIAPLRLDTPAKGTEGVRQWSHLHGLLPRLGFFVGQEQRLPVDDDELLALVAPKQVLLVAPELDRYSPIADVRQAARGGHIKLETPNDFHRFTPSTQEMMFKWLDGAAQAPR